ncbi:MAG: hypothetical protein PHS92_05200 [Candidatus Gracilibacteria bacterium]|nr:hypothetical protein [Candidatus Gracilibacteria bacterium]
MVWVFLTTIFGSIADILYKKAVSVSNIKSNVFQFIGEILSIPIIIVFLFLDFNFHLFIDLRIISLFLLTIVLFIINNNLCQYLYKNEKLSTLLPYFKINNFIVISVGFLFFNDSSLISFLICVGAILLTMTFSVDFKKRSIPKNLGKILLYEAISAVKLIISVYILKSITNIEYVVLDQTFYIIFGFLTILYFKELDEFKKMNIEIIKYRSSSYVFGFANYFIGIFLLQNFGVVITTLFGFFGSSLSIFLAYFFLKEVPVKKDIILGFLLIMLVGFGYYYR